jgi:hypothetical protein
VTGPIPGTFSSKRAERVYVRYDAISGQAVAVVFRMTDGSKVLYPLYQYAIVPNKLSMNAAMPVPVESSLDEDIAALHTLIATLQARVTALEAMPNNGIGGNQAAHAQGK